MENKSDLLRIERSFDSFKNLMQFVNNNLSILDRDLSIAVQRQKEVFSIVSIILASNEDKIFENEVLMFSDAEVSND